MPNIVVEQRRRPPRYSLAEIFLGNAVFLACAMLWYAIVYTRTSYLSANGPLPSRASFASMSLKSKKQTIRFHQPLVLDQIHNILTIGESINEEENGKVTQFEEKGGSRQEEMNSKASTGKTDTRGKAVPEVVIEGQAGQVSHEAVSTARSNITAPAIATIGDETTNKTSKSHPCSKFEAVLHIESGDQGAAAGTLFFQYMINQLIYADMHNLMPFIHLNNVTHNVYDEGIHGAGDGVNITAASKLYIPWENLLGKGGWPGKPYARDLYWNATTLWFRGTGVWNHYFEPVSQYDPNHSQCQALKYVTLDYEFLNPGIQFYAPWAVRSWEYLYLPAYLRSKALTNGNLHNWFDPQRIRAHEIVKKYFQFKPGIELAASDLVPHGTQCLAVHIRHSDKAGLARRKIPAEEFLPYINAYIMNGGGQVYLATDSSRVLEYAQLNWQHVKLIVQGGIVRSAVFKPVFRQSSHNRTNTEVLVDILAMARCQYMIHGYSAVSESTHYMNLGLHNRSVDLEDRHHMNITEFGDLIKRETSKT